MQNEFLPLFYTFHFYLFGLIALDRLPVRELPDIDPPIVSVTTVYPGASAAVVETEVRLTEPLVAVSVPPAPGAE